MYLSPNNSLNKNRSKSAGSFKSLSSKKSQSSIKICDHSGSSFLSPYETLSKSSFASEKDKSQIPKSKSHGNISDHMTPNKNELPSFIKHIRKPRVLTLNEIELLHIDDKFIEEASHMVFNPNTLAFVPKSKRFY